MHVHSQIELPLSRMGFVALAIKPVTDTQLHIGVLHRRDSGNPRLLHLAWHHDLRNDLPPDDYFWIEVNIHAKRLRQVAALCRKVWRANPYGVPYAFSLPVKFIDTKSGQVLLGGTRLGLTCASFVLAVFEAAGIKLIEYATWPTKADIDWQEHVIQQLARRVTSDYLTLLKAEIGNARFRPDEVAAAAASNSIPATFEEVKEQSQLLNSIVRQ